MSDGGHVCLDWYNERGPSQPTLVVLPGLTGKGSLIRKLALTRYLVTNALVQLLQVAVMRTM